MYPEPELKDSLVDTNWNWTPPLLHFAVDVVNSVKLEDLAILHTHSATFFPSCRALVH